MRQAFLLVFIVLLISRCGTEDTPDSSLAGSTVKTSELAVLMRQIHAEAKTLRRQVVSGDTVFLVTQHQYEKLTSATPTDADVGGPVFAGYAQQYQLALDSLLHSRGKLAAQTYNDLVKSCVACHETYCPGPIPTIKKLQVKANLQAFRK